MSGAIEGNIGQVGIQAVAVVAAAAFAGSAPYAKHGGAPRNLLAT